MPIDLTILCRELKPERTAILFGAGSSVPSGGLTGAALSELLCKQFGVAHDPTLSLAETATLVEMRVPRREIIAYLRKRFEPLQPTRGLLNLPLYEWRDIFTTNFDTLLEQAYSRAEKPLRVFSSNFDFEDGTGSATTSLFKIHGTLEQDRSFGHVSSVVLTTQDYDLASEYRELVFDRFLHETSSGDYLVIGHSLSDADLMPNLNEALRRKKKTGAPGKLYVLVYAKDLNRAALLEQRGFVVCFGGLDEFFAALKVEGPERRLVYQDASDILGQAPQLRPVTVDINHAIHHEQPDVVRLFNGAPASYGDIQADLTFSRDVSATTETQLMTSDKPVAYVLGPAGFGKTTLCRQIMASLVKRGLHCWEHRSDYRLDHSGWIKIANHCQSHDTEAALFVDDAHLQLRAIDNIVDHLVGSGNRNLRLLLASAPSHWHPRSKTPSIYKLGVEQSVGRLTYTEINSLLDLFDRKREIAALVEGTFAGFSRQEKLRRLVDRCRSDMFVCMKNIFSFDSLDDIILRDYAAIDDDLQDIYRTVAAMEASNVRVHRQLVMRLLGIKAAFVRGILDRLVGIISEYDVDPANGIYAWRGRHQVISELILKYKYHDQADLFRLYKLVIDHINPTYEIERVTINELCDIHTGVGRLQNQQQQNFLYRKMISIAPSQRPPRHRLIYNLIKSGEFDPAANEIRLFEKETRRDAPLLRYKSMLLMERARAVTGLMKEDRLTILAEAASVAQRALQQFPSDRGLHSTNCDIGLEILKLSGEWGPFDTAIEKLASAEQEYLDPELGRLLARKKLRAESLGSSAK